MPDVSAMARQSEEEKEELTRDLDFGPIAAVVIAGMLAVGLAVGINRRRKS